jgi:hypothetical protein
LARSPWNGSREITSRAGDPACLSRAFAERAAADWPTLPGFLSQRLAALAARLGHPIRFHLPSRVEHTGQHSAWGGHIQRAVDFAHQ